MVQEVAGGEDMVAVVLEAVVILLLLVVVVVVEGGGAPELGSHWDLVDAGLPACSSPCCMRYNTHSTACSTEATRTAPNMLA